MADMSATANSSAARSAHLEAPNPRAVNRCRISRRRNLGQEALDEYLNENFLNDLTSCDFPFTEESTSDTALALALSLSNFSSILEDSSSELVAGEMSYENLVLFEDVKNVAPPVVVDSLQVLLFEGIKNQPSSKDLSSGVCAVCQSEYVMAEKQILLPCCHNFHHACGAEWLLNYSKLCPVCKHDVTV